MTAPAQAINTLAGSNSANPTFSIRDLIDATIILEKIFKETGYWLADPEYRSRFRNMMGTGEYKGLLYQLDEIDKAMKGLPKELMPAKPKPHYLSRHSGPNHIVH
jgi:hypothetical protein